MRVGDAVPALYFLSDYGHADEFVGVVHAVLHRWAPGVRVVDLGHEVPPFDVAAGAAMLVRCAPALGTGVVLAVVDPGVGSDRRGVAVETAGPGPSWLVGPDNGLLVPLAETLGGARRAIVLRSSRAAARLLGRTFDGRDLFAPAAAHLVRGRSPAELGVAVDPASLVGGADRSRPPGPSERSAQPSPVAEVASQVTWIDRYGNVELAAGPDVLERFGLGEGDPVRVVLSDRPARAESARWVGAFADLAEGELGLLIDSGGKLAVVLCQASAAERLRPIGVGDPVRLSPGGGGARG